MKHKPHISYYIPPSTFRRGFGLVEVVVAAGLLSLAGVAMIGAYNLVLSSSLKNISAVKAVFLAEEGLEAVRLMRDDSWSGNISPLAASTTYWLSFSTSTAKWQATTTPVFVDGFFERTLVLQNAYRDGNSDLASAGTLDPDAKKVVVSVSWRRGQATTTKTLTTYLTNMFE